MNKLLISLLTIFCINFSSAQTNNKTNYKWLANKSLELESRSNLQKIAVQNYTNKFGIQRKLKNDSLSLEIVGIANGRPLVYMTHNLNAAKTISTNKLWSGEELGLSLDGSNIFVAEWDGGVPLSTHQEFGNRITVKEISPEIEWHATHVAGTIMAAGAYSDAKGMAPNATLDCYDWTNDESEMATAAANGLLLSNHSYGFITGWHNGFPYEDEWSWFGDPAISETEDYNFGFYSSSSAEWDAIAYNAPNYLIVKSAGNDRNDDITNSGDEHWVQVNGVWTKSTDIRKADGNYDCISSDGVSKNILTVAAVEDIPNGYSSPSDVVMTSFSSWGPVDDGRIKPDISANGSSLLSTYSTGNDQYAWSSGTSMSAPSVTGSLVLIQQHNKNLYGTTLKAATLKALVVNTADEAGSSDGPDYQFGWGLMNTASAVNVITNDQTIDVTIQEETLTNNSIFEYNIYSDGSSTINITLSWTDPAGTPVTAKLNPRDPMLVNDLDLRITRQNNDVVFYPWKLDPDNPANAAITGDNIVDNIEKITISSPQEGNYKVVVSHKGNIGSSQNFSIVTTGINEDPNTSSLTLTAPNGGEVWEGNLWQEIKWEAINVDNISIHYSIDNGENWLTITDSVSAASGSYIWTISNTPSGSCLVKIADINDELVSDISDATFTIVEGKRLDLITPNGGEKWQVGSQQQILWQSNGIENVSIDYSTNNGEDWTSITSAYQASSGSYNWTIPNSPSEICLIKVSDNSNSQIADTSESVFKISKIPDITLTSPNGGERWQTGSMQQITWNSVEVDSIALYYTVNNGANWTLIVESFDASTTSYDWIIPNTLGNGCFVQIVDISNNLVNDMNNDAFSIIEASNLVLTSPVGNEKWEVGSSQLITWDAVEIDQILIEFSFDDGANWEIIADLVAANNSSFNWIVANNPSTNCFIKISDVGTSGLLSQNTKPFTISEIPLVNLISPNGNENWVVESEQRIEWSYVEVENLGIDVSIDNGVNWTNIFETIPAANKFIEWNIPNTPSKECLIKIYAIENHNLTDVSYTLFTISEKPEVVLTSPKGGDILKSNKSFDITWTSKEVENIMLEYAISRGDWQLIATDISAALEKYNWSVPEVSSNEVQVRISDVSNPDVYSFGDGFFTIINPQLSLIQPNGGEEWMENSLQEIVWTKNDIESIDVYYSNNNGSDWILIESAVTDADNTLDWQVPNILSDQYLVKIIDHSDSTLSDLSNNTFTVVGDPVSVKNLTSIPEDFILLNNYPNPFNPTTNIRFGLPNPSNVSVTLFNSIGERILDLTNKNYSAGYHTITFDASDFTSGIYYYMFRAGNFTDTKKMLLIK